jgi:hypothetical protein
MSLAPSPQPLPTPDADPAVARLRTGLRGLALLAGSVRGTDLSRSIARSVLDLPVGEGLTILSAWARHADALAADLGIESIEVRVLVDRGAIDPTTVRSLGRAHVSIREDRNELRGTGGLLRDVTGEFLPDDLLLIAHANQIVLGDFTGAVRTLAAAGADIALLIGEDGIDHGVMLVRCGALGPIRADGFVDFKEQALPAIAREFVVRAVAEHDATTLPVRTARKYLDAMRRTGAKAVDPEHLDEMVMDDWKSTFSVVEPGASVGAGVRLHDSVVLSGAKVGDGAVLVRCIVGEGAVVAPRVTLRDEIVPAPLAQTGEGGPR